VTINNSPAPYFQLIPKVTALFVLLCGLLVLCGQLYFPAVLRQELPVLAAMPAMAALAFVLMGFSLRLARWEGMNSRVRLQAQILRFLNVALAAFLFGQYFGVIGSGLGYVPLPTALGFVLLSMTVMLLSGRRSFHACQTLICISGLISLTALTARLYSLQSGRPLPGTLDADGASSLLLMMCAVGLLYSNTHRGLMAIVTSETVGGARARLLLPASIVVPILLGWIRLILERAGVIDQTVGMVAHVVATILILALIVAWNSQTLVRTMKKKEEIEQGLRELEMAYRALLERSSQAVYISDLQGNIKYMNASAEWLFGCRGRVMNGHNINEFLAPCGDEAFESLDDLLGGLSRPKLMLLRCGGAVEEVQVSSIARFRNGTPVEIMAMVDTVSSFRENSEGVSGLLA
jgi:PAS domain S-box-containing protein